MLVVVDANVLCSALMAKGRTAELLFSGHIEAIGPEMLFAEVESHREELRARSKLSTQDFDELLSKFKEALRIVPAEEFTEFLQEASELLYPHTKDTEYVALALRFGCPLWSKKKLLKRIGRIEALDADEVAKRALKS